MLFNRQIQKVLLDVTFLRLKTNKNTPLKMIETLSELDFFGFLLEKFCI